MIYIIGAGLSGIACAHALKKNNIPVTIIEKSDRIGGKLQSWVTEDGFHYEHGFRCYGQNYLNLLGFFKEIGIIDNLKMPNFNITDIDTFYHIRTIRNEIIFNIWSCFQLLVLISICKQRLNEIEDEDISLYIKNLSSISSYNDLQGMLWPATKCQRSLKLHAAIIYPAIFQGLKFLFPSLFNDIFLFARGPTQEMILDPIETYLKSEPNPVTIITNSCVTNFEYHTNNIILEINGDTLSRISCQYCVIATQNDQVIQMGLSKQIPEAKEMKREWYNSVTFFINVLLKSNVPKRSMYTLHPWKISYIVYDNDTWDKNNVLKKNTKSIISCIISNPNDKGNVFNKTFKESNEEEILYEVFYYLCIKLNLFNFNQLILVDSGTKLGLIDKSIDLLKKTNNNTMGIFTPEVYKYMTGPLTSMMGVYKCGTWTNPGYFLREETMESAFITGYLAANEILTCFSIENIEIKDDIYNLETTSNSTILQSIFIWIFKILRYIDTLFYQNELFFINLILIIIVLCLIFFFYVVKKYHLIDRLKEFFQ